MQAQGRRNRFDLGFDHVTRGNNFLLVFFFVVTCSPGRMSDNNFSREMKDDSNPASSLSNSRITKPTTFPDQGISPSLILFVHSSNFRLSPSILVAIITCAETKKEEGEKSERTERIFGPREIPSFTRYGEKDSAAQLYEIKRSRLKTVEESSLGWRRGISLRQMGKLRFEEILNYSQQRFETVHPCFAISKEGLLVVEKEEGGEDSLRLLIYQLEVWNGTIGALVVNTVSGNPLPYASNAPSSDAR